MEPFLGAFNVETHFWLKSLFPPLVSPGPEWHSCRKVHSWRGSSLVSGRPRPSWAEPGSHPSSLPRVLPVWHWGLLWLHPTGQRGDTGKLAQGWTVHTRHYRGKIISAFTWGLCLFSQIHHNRFDRLWTVHEGWITSLDVALQVYMLQSAAHSTQTACRPSEQAGTGVLFLLSSLSLKGNWTPSNLSILHGCIQALDILRIRRIRICLCRCAALVTFQHNTRQQSNGFM